MSNLVEIRRSGPVGSLVLNDPGTVNSLSLQMTCALRAAFAELAGDDGIRVVLLEGAGQNFSAGGNLNDALACAREGPRGAARFMASFNALIRAAFYFPKPMIGVVRGTAAGGALGLLLCSDIILLAHGARIMQAFIHVALAPDCGTSTLLARRVGVGRAKELTLTGRQVSAEEACRIGLADELHADDRLGPQAMRLAETIASKSPLAVTHTKQLMQRAQFAVFEDALELEGSAQALLMQSSDFREGVAAFREKRRAVFTGS